MSNFHCLVAASFDGIPVVFDCQGYAWFVHYFTKDTEQKRNYHIVGALYS